MINENFGSDSHKNKFGSDLLNAKITGEVEATWVPGTTLFLSFSVACQSQKIWNEKSKQDDLTQGRRQFINLKTIFYCISADKAEKS